MLLLKRAVTKFKGQINDGASSTNDSAGTPQTAIPPSVAPGSATERVATATRIARTRAGTPDAAAPQPVRAPAIAVVSSDADATATPMMTPLEKKRSLEVGGVGAVRQSSLRKDTTGYSRWRTMGNNNNQRSQPGLNASPSFNDQTSAAASAAESQQQSAPVVASTMMHDFNLSMSEYRTEMKDNIGQLNDKINKLENVILKLSDSLPQLVEQIGGQQQQQQRKQSPAANK